MSISQLELDTSRREYTALLNVSQPSADILDRIGYLEQTFDLIQIGEIKIKNEKSS